MTTLSLPSAKFPIEILNSDDTPYMGPQSHKSTVRIKIEVPTDKDAAPIIGFLNSPTFRAEFEEAKSDLGLANYGMDHGQFYPLIGERDGKRVALAYVRDIKLTRRV